MKLYSKIAACMALVAGTFLNASAQSLEDMPKLKEIKGKKLLEELTPKQEKGLWGYVGADGKFIIKPVFTDACPYEGNLARISVNHKWGTIKDNGLYGITPYYDGIAPYSSDSLAIASYNGKYGLIDAKGIWIQRIIYTSLENADYGYLMAHNGKYGTIDHKGNILLEPQFDEVLLLDRSRQLYQICKDGKWGVMKDGSEVLALKWDSKMTLLQSGSDGYPDVYLVSQNGRIGAVSSYGDFVIPCVYDSIELASSGNYFVTSRDGKYGAISLKLHEIMSPVMDSKPYIGEDLYRVFYNGMGYAANINGKVEFENCAGIYSMFKPEEYLTTKAIPEWTKTDLIENNCFARQDRLDSVRRVCDRMAECGYNPALAAEDSSLPQNVALSLPMPVEGKWSDKYGIMNRGDFARSSGILTDETTEGTINYNIHYKAPGNYGGSMYLLSNAADGELLLRLDDNDISLKKAFSALNIKKFTGFYPKDYARLSDDLIIVAFAFLRPAAEVGTELVETNPYLLPVGEFAMNVHKGNPNPKAETSLAIIFNIDSLEAVSCTQLPAGGGNILLGSKFGGFYTCASKDIVADSSTPLRKYDRHGVLDWEYMPGSGEKFYDIEETENYIYICGGMGSGSESPLMVQLSKRGRKIQEARKDFANARFVSLMCKDCLMYVKTSFLKGAPSTGSDFYPLFNLEDMGDNVGVRIACAWEPWGNGEVGGCGLVSDKGVWLQAPMLSQNQICTAFDWEFGAFTSSHLVVRHMVKYGLINRDGEITIDTKYDALEILQNPDYLKASLNGCYGVLDVTGKVIVPLEYDYVGNMSEDVIIVSKDGKYGCFDKEGRMTVPLEYEEIREYAGGMARIRFMERFGFIDKNGNILVAPFSDEVEDFHEGRALVTIMGGVGFVDFEKNWIARPMYQAGGNFSGGLAPLCMDGKYGYIDLSGAFVIPMKYSQAKEFDATSGLACVAIGNKWGVIGKDGRVVVPLEFDLVSICTDGCIYVEKGGKCGLYNASGKKIYPIICDKIFRRDDGSVFRYGIAEADLKGNRISIDEAGNTIVKYSMLKEEQ